jgi:predicted nucleic acid-binding Zn ribbon protein|tara:strand:- start:215 stop:388 length:174 start_codon:yes stop_codon:yes gene_type:complete
MSRPTVIDVKHQIDTHEAVCAERWLETINRVKRLELIMMASAGAIITLLLTLVADKI